MKFVLQSLVLVLATLFYISGQANAQSPNDLKAQALYFEAEKALKNQQYEQAITLSDQARETLGTNNALLSSLNVRALYGAGQYQKAKLALDEYNSFQPSAELNRSLSSIVLNIEEKIKQQEMEMRLQEEAEAARRLAQQEENARLQAEQQKLLQQQALGEKARMLWEKTDTSSLNDFPAGLSIADDGRLYIVNQKYHAEKDIDCNLIVLDLDGREILRNSADKKKVRCGAVTLGPNGRPYVLGTGSYDRMYSFGFAYHLFEVKADGEFKSIQREKADEVEGTHSVSALTHQGNGKFLAFGKSVRGVDNGSISSLKNTAAVWGHMHDSGGKLMYAKGYEVTKAISLTSGETLILFRYLVNGSTKAGRVAKSRYNPTSKSVNFLWDKAASSDNHFSFWDAVQINSNEAVVFARMNIDDGWGLGFTVLNLTTGTFEPFKIDRTKKISVTSAKLHPKGGFLVAGMKVDEQDFIKPWIGRYDENFNLIWSKTVSATKGFLKDIELTDNGDVVFIGTKYNEAGGTNLHYGRLETSAAP